MDKIFTNNIKQISTLFFGILMLCTGTIFANNQDSLLINSTSKKGWNIMPFPEIAYNSNLGFQYGIYCELYNFGDGSNYPDYKHKFCFEIAQYTKGSGAYCFYYDSPQLWKNHRISVDIAYLPDNMCDFYGYNGRNAPYYNIDNDSFYKIEREQFRIIFGLQGEIFKQLYWMAGISWQKMTIGPVSLKNI